MFNGALEVLKTNKAQLFFFGKLQEQTCHSDFVLRENFVFDFSALHLSVKMSSDGQKEMILEKQENIAVIQIHQETPKNINKR